MFARAFVMTFAVVAFSIGAQAHPGGGWGSGHVQDPGGALAHGHGDWDHHGGGGDWDDHGGWHRGGGDWDGGWHRGDGWHGGGVYIPGDNWGRDPWNRCDWGNCDGGYVGGSIACAPKTFESNVSKTDSVLKSLAASKDFASATQFKKQVATISSQKDAAKKATAYLKLAGIDSNNSAAIVEFVGARNARGSWINELQHNSNLTSVQAETVASKLQTALRGGLQ